MHGLPLRPFAIQTLDPWKMLKDIMKDVLKAKNRRDQLYGKRSKEEESPALQHLRELFEVRLRQHPEAERFRRDLDNVEQGFANVHIPQEARKRKAPKNKYACVKCGVSQETNGGKLMKCSRCNLASYCSKDCQIKVRNIIGEKMVLPLTLLKTLRVVTYFSSNIY